MLHSFSAKLVASAASEEIQDLFFSLESIIVAQADMIKSLQIRQGNMEYDLDKRMTDIERYSSWACLIFSNLPNAYMNGHPTDIIVRFINEVLQIPIAPKDISICHYLGDPSRTPIICKFLYHWQRDAVYNRKFTFRDLKNAREYYTTISERLTKQHKEILFAARDMGAKATTRNGQVFVETDVADDRGHKL